MADYLGQRLGSVPRRLRRSLAEAIAASSTDAEAYFRSFVAQLTVNDFLDVDIHSDLLLKLRADAAAAAACFHAASDRAENKPVSYVEACMRAACTRLGDAVEAYTYCYAALVAPSGQELLDRSFEFWQHLGINPLSCIDPSTWRQALDTGDWIAQIVKRSAVEIDNVFPFAFPIDHPLQAALQMLGDIKWCEIDEVDEMMASRWAIDKLMSGEILTLVPWQSRPETHFSGASRCVAPASAPHAAGGVRDVPITWQWATWLSEPEPEPEPEPCPSPLRRGGVGQPPGTSGAGK